MEDRQKENIEKFYQAYGGFGVTFEYTIDGFREIIYLAYHMNYGTPKESIELLIADDSAFSIFNKLKLVLNYHYIDEESNSSMLKKIYNYVDKLIAFRNGLIHGQWITGLITTSNPNVAFGFHNKSSSKKGIASRQYIISSQRVEVITAELRTFNLLLSNLKNRIRNQDPISHHKDDDFFNKLEKKVKRLNLSEYYDQRKQKN